MGAHEGRARGRGDRERVGMYERPCGNGRCRRVWAHIHAGAGECEYMSAWMRRVQTRMGGRWTRRLGMSVSEGINKQYNKCELTCDTPVMYHGSWMGYQPLGEVPR